MPTKISSNFSEPALALAFDTLKMGKQALIFANTKRSAEKTAEEIAKQIVDGNENLLKIAMEAKGSLSTPTRQCERLSYCLRKGIAFHHAGLTQKQKEIVEDNFRKGVLKIICCTPTLAYGVDLPAFRVIIKDLKRFGRHGLAWIPVLEYLQQAGRAGRPKYDSLGQAIAIAQSDGERDKIYEMYIKGEPEEIHSKLAVEPALRMYVLSLIATGIVSSREEISDFFEKTFWAHQYQDPRRLDNIIEKILYMLEEWEFLRESNGIYTATPIGRRISELYIDPYTAYYLVECLRRGASKTVNIFSVMHMISSTLEMRPRVKAKMKDIEDLQHEVAANHDSLLAEEPPMFEAEYDDFLDSVKTAMMFTRWAEEDTEEILLENFNVRPGELQVKLDMADWLLYASHDLCTLLHFPSMRREISKARFRVKYGIKEELLPLVRLDQVGRVRARKLYSNGIKDLGDVKKADIALLSRLLGKNIAALVKKQVGQDMEKIKPEAQHGEAGFGAPLQRWS
ncbi:MAG TPA: helicase-related protein [Candidatus Nanoarchaeia archaeon]|nr:helicase-related protein [Candidatus Nanoarchaeia archaeon]